jgi:hypothetical protein
MKLICRILILSILVITVFSIKLNPKDQRKIDLNENQADQTVQVSNDDQKKIQDAVSKSTSGTSTSPSLDSGSSSGYKEDTSVKKDLGDGFVRPAMVPEGTLPLTSSYDSKKKF